MKKNLPALLFLGLLASLFAAPALVVRANNLVGIWSTTGSLNTARSEFTAILLNNGRVLVAGGSDTRGTNFVSAELFSSTSGPVVNALPNATPTPTPQPPPMSVVVSSLPNASLPQGNFYTASGSFTDPGATSWKAKVDYGDGTVQDLQLSDMTFSLKHLYTDVGTYTVTVTITENDNQGATGTGTATVTVNDVAPTVVSISVPATAVVNTPVSALAFFTDPGVFETFKASWNWGDGTKPTDGTVTNIGLPKRIVGPDSHIYTTPGVYTLTLSVTDNYGLTGTGQVLVAVSPSGGFSGANLAGLNYSGANLSNQNLSGSNLHDSTFNNTNLQNANLKGVNASGASFQQANLTGADLAGANLSGAKLQGAKLTGANLAGANFRGANLQGAKLINATLTGTNLQKATLTNADLSGANLQGANLQGATVTGITWSNTICPDSTNSNNDGGTCTGHGGGL